jgi:hypothetical protein
MRRQVASFQIGPHAVDVLESLDRDTPWYHLVVDGLLREILLSAPPDADEAAELLLMPDGTEG